MAEKLFCQVSNKTLPPHEVVKATTIREPIVNLIKQQVPDFKSEGYISTSELNKFRIQHVQQMMESEKGELSDLERKVLDSIGNKETLSENIHKTFTGKLTLGQKLADKIAAFGGSWTFIISFFSFLLGWVVLNTINVFIKPFDPYPFIFLNLMLSCIAAIQAPIIMMSQNRQGEKDRMSAENDYMVNLKTELEIRIVQEKIDHMRTKQWERLIEIQQVQLDLLQELAEKKEKK